MSENDPPDIPEDELEDLEDLTELIGDEIPVLGTVRRVYRFVRKKLSKEYIEKIRRLRQKEKILIKTIDQQNQNILDLRNYISGLEARLKELEGSTDADDKKS